MIITTVQLIDVYNMYSDPKGKIGRDVKDGKLFTVSRGLYETNRNVEGFKLSQFIYGPSYLSFDYVLYKNSIIPETVYQTYTCATFNKGKRKEYRNQFGLFLYRDVPKKVYEYGVSVIVEEEYTYQIASKEKALLDKLYIMSPVHSIKDLKELLFDDLRIDVNELDKMDKEFIFKVAPLYHSTNLKLLIKYLKGAKDGKSIKSNVI